MLIRLSSVVSDSSSSTLLWLDLRLLKIIYDYLTIYILNFTVIIISISPIFQILEIQNLTNVTDFHSTDFCF